MVEHKLHVTNTVIKWLLDQTAGSWANNVAFVVVLTAIRGGGMEACLSAVRSVGFVFTASLFGFLTSTAILGAADGRLQALAVRQHR